MELNNKHSEQEEKLGSLLRKLPKVDASADFEAGLQRKLSARTKPSREMGFLSTFLFSQRVPVFVTSILALFAVSVISYYLFINTKSNVTDQRMVISQPEQSLTSVQKESGSESKTISPPVTGIEEQTNRRKLLQRDEQTITNSPTVSGRIEKHRKSESSLEDASQTSPTRNESVQDVNTKDNDYAQPSVEMETIAPSTAPSTQQFQSAEPAQEQSPTTKQIQVDQSNRLMQSMQSAQPLQLSKSVKQAPEESSQIRSETSIDEVLSKQKENATGAQMNKYLRGGRASESKMEQINPSAVMRSPRYSMSVPIDTSKADSLRRDSIKNIEKQGKKRKP